MEFINVLAKRLANRGNHHPNVGNRFGKGWSIDVERA
jgi:pterin-4a-carbinolamine dehydratase